MAGNEELRSDSDESLSPIFGFCFDEDGNAKSQWGIDPQLSPLKPKESTGKDSLTSATLEVKEFKPEFPGFATAGGKAITVSKKALEEAKKKFDWTDDEDCNTNCQPASSPSNSRKKETGFAGFSTASGKSIKISQKALDAAKSKFEMNLSTSSPNTNDMDVSGKVNDKVNGCEGFSTASGKSIKISQKAIDEAKGKFDMELSTCSPEITETGRLGDTQSISDKTVKLEGLTKFDYGSTSTSMKKQFPGFATAGGKAITVSEKALEEAKKKFDWTDDENGNSNCQSIPYPTNSCNLKETGFAGFSTASGKSIKISQKAIDEAKSKFDMDLSTSSPSIPGTDLSGKVNDKVDGFAGFSTASGKSIKISKKAIDEAKSKFDMELSTCSTSKPGTDVSGKVNDIVNGFAGFSTASGKSINISKKAIDEAKSKFDMDLSTSSPNVPGGEVSWKVNDKVDGFEGFSTASGKSIKISKKAIDEAKNKFDMELSTCSTKIIETGLNKFNCVSPSSSPMKKQFPGFATAGGKGITVSKKALEEAKKKFDWVDDENSNSDCQPESSQTNTLNLKENVRVAGFSTASGQSVKISQKAIDETKSKFDMDLSTCSANMLDSDTETPISDVTKPLSVSCTSNVFDFGQTSSLSPEESTEVADLTRSLLEDISTNDESIWENGDVNTSETVSLTTLQSMGETIPLIKLFVVRAYPVVYCIKSASSFLYLSEKAHFRRTISNESKEEELRDKLLPNIEQKVRNSFFGKKHSKLDIRTLEDMSVDDIVIHLNCLEDSSPFDILDRLSQTKKKQVEETRITMEEKIRAAVHEEFTKELQALELQSRASPVFKLRVIDVDSRFTVHAKSVIGNVKSGIISIWNPNDDILKAIEENRIFEFHSLKPNNFQPCQDVRLSTTKGTRIHPVETPLVSTCFTRKFSTIEEVLSDDFAPLFEEFDTIGVIVEISPYTTSSGQIIHLSDSNNNILKVKFWNSLKDAGLEELIKVGIVLVCTDLQWRISSAKIGVAFAQDVSSFQTNTKMEHLIKGYQDACAVITSVVTKSSDIKREDKSLIHLPETNQVVELEQETIDPVVAARKTRASMKRRYLEKYDEPPELPVLYNPAKRGRISKKFVPPRPAERK